MINFFNNEFFIVFFISTFFFFLSGFGMYLGSEIYSVNLGMNQRSESFSFLNSQLEIMSELKIFHDSYLSSIIFGIGFLTMVIIVYLYFTEETSLGMTSNFFVELSWIVIPMVVLILIGFPSIEFMYKMEEGEGADSYSLKSTGFQWFWSYENSLNSFDSYMSNDLDSDSPLYLSSLNKVSLPSFTPIQNVVSSGDVMHSWALPSIMMKIDAIPGRMNTLSFSLPWMESSNLYGQCSELCGVNHSFMPIVVNVKSL
nr:cytochrome c oxidase subunit II [Heterochaerus australis]